MVDFTESKEQLHQQISNLLELGNCKVAVLCDSNTLKYCYPLIADIPELHKCEILEIEPGEDSKTIEVTAQLWECLQDFTFNRNDVLLCLGGGVITDLGGFIASTFKRGMRFIHIPTSYTGMVDAAIGGKQGINFNGVKNQIGVFNQPDATLICAEFLESLPQRELHSGYIETIKHALVGDALLWDKIEAGASLNSAEIIMQSNLVKQTIVEQDPTEKGARKSLNFGHTIGHAFEAYHKNDLLHGEAVAIGILAELILSMEMLGFSEESFQSIQKRVIDLVPIGIKLENLDALIELMKQDKKNDGSGINFTLLNGVSDFEINQYVAPDVIKSAIEKVFDR